MRRSKAFSDACLARQRGVTLLELFVVLALVAIMAALASPYFGAMIGRYRLNAATREVSGLIKTARVLAVTRSAKVRVLFTEVDGNVFNAKRTGGVLRLEMLVFNGATWSWQPVDASTAPPNNACKVGGRTVAYCVDMKTLYPHVSLVQVDAVGLTGSEYTTGGEYENGTGKPALFYNADGIVGNSNNDFKMGSDARYIQVVVANKKGGSGLEARLVEIDRGGGVTIKPYQGTGLPSS